MTPKRPAAWLVDLSLVVVALIWGATFVLVKQALADVSTLLFLTLRFGIAALALGLLFYRELAAPGLGRSLRGGCIVGFFLFSGYLLQTAGLRYTTASKAGFITGLYIPLVPLFSAILYRRMPQLTEIAGVALAFVGLTLITVQRDLLDIGRGDLLVAGCAVAYSFHMLALGRFAKDTAPGLLALTQISTCALLAGATFWWAEPVHLQFSAPVWIALAVTSLLATALAFVVQSWAQRWNSPTGTALIFSMEPVFAWATSYVVAGELLSRRGAEGAVLILAGILLVELRRKPVPITDQHA